MSAQPVQGLRRCAAADDCTGHRLPVSQVRQPEPKAIAFSVQSVLARWASVFDLAVLSVGSQVRREPGEGGGGEGSDERGGKGAGAGEGEGEGGGEGAGEGDGAGEGGKGGDRGGDSNADAGVEVGGECGVGGGDGEQSMAQPLHASEHHLQQQHRGCELLQNRGRGLEQWLSLIHI
eukprot:2324283-Rhodomonas_salina.1